MSDSAAGEEPQPLVDEPVISRQTQLIPVNSLLAADSPRLAGEVEEHARTLAESEAALPPIVVHRPTMRVVDGMHRLRAAVLRGDDLIEVRFVDGTAEDAFVLAVRLNADHGMPLSRQDRVAAAIRIVESHPAWSDRRIAAVTGLSPGMVGSLRARAGGTAQLALRTGRDGRRRPVNGAAGRLAASRVIAETPDASLREIASRAGIAVATARDVRQRMRLGQDPVTPRLRLAVGADDPGEGAEERFDASAASVSPLVWESMLSSISRDPSLRMSQIGRRLLQLLRTHMLTAEQRKDLIDGIPAHRTADVAQMARMCASRWLQFARDVEGRSPDDVGEAGERQAEQLSSSGARVGGAASRPSAGRPTRTTRETTHDHDARPVTSAAPARKGPEMTNPFDDQQARCLVLVNAENQHSLWPASAAVPAGWSVAHGEAGRQECLEYIERTWTDTRPRPLAAAPGQG
ncbi:MbtH family NRPS accessory protein [Streptomyces sp. NK08204]|uniref:MbtH family NRPS accessory protein n=1 Tax=Streptomyces sp. NK08204 TaxID=2873260 RepID=UPI0027E3285E|nr:MbtH family NRPS accessory protein [Streptomyces sp. NK08204]